MLRIRSTFDAFPLSSFNGIGDYFTDCFSTGLCQLGVFCAKGILGRNNHRRNMGLTVS